MKYLYLYIIVALFAAGCSSTTVNERKINLPTPSVEYSQ